MELKNIRIAVSQSCASASSRWPGARTIDIRQAGSIKEYFAQAGGGHTLLILSDQAYRPASLMPEPDGAAIMYHSLATFCAGSVRDDFDFGPAVLIDNVLAAKAIELMSADSKLAGFYDFRLMMQTLGPIVRADRSLVSAEKENHDFESAHFAYCDPRNREYQIEAEAVFTKYLRMTGGYIIPAADGVGNFRQLMARYPRRASVIIPVKDRPEVIADAIHSALGQKTDFEYNVIVVDNQSQKPTRDILNRCMAEDSRLHVIETTGPGIGIGGCWNIGIQSPECGAIAVQLDSDDVYSSPNTLQQIVDKFMEDRCGVLIGSYRLTDINLNPLNDIIIDHREYTQENGANNALRVNGFGAPRCYLTELVRQNPFRNVSYGEDYDLCLRLSRQYRVSRIYDVLYYCRRWGKNSDSNLTPQKLAEFNLMKDTFRTQELELRKTLSAGQAR